MGQSNITMHSFINLFSEKSAVRNACTSRPFKLEQGLPSGRGRRRGEKEVRGKSTVPVWINSYYKVSFTTETETEQQKWLRGN